MNLSLQEIANLIDGFIEGDNSIEIHRLNSLEHADRSEISYAVNKKYKEALINSKASAIIVNEELKEYCYTNKIVVKNVYLAYSILSHKFKQTQDINDLSFGNDVSYPDTEIASSSLIGKNVQIGPRTKIHHNCVIENNTNIGQDCLIESNVTIQHGSIIGDNCIISP